jgi:photosystem II stability/assembly factor-like uncharacterized protein
MKKIILLSALIINSSILFSQWTLQSTVTGLGSYPSISVYSPTGVVIAGGLVSTPSAKVYKSTNGGVNWVDISGDLPPRRPYALWALNGDTIYVGDAGANGSGGDARLYKTMNGGINWIQILNTGGVGGWFNDIIFSRINPMIGIAQSDPPNYGGEHFLAKTTDGGNNWYVQPTIATGGPSDMHTAFCIDNLFYGWGVNGAFGQKKILVTTNGGINWNEISTNLPGNDFIANTSAFNSDKTIGIAGSWTTLPIISRTTDGGNNWVQINTGLPVSGQARMKWIHGTNICYTMSDSGASGCAMKSINGGLNWSLMNTAGIIRFYNFEYYISNGTVYMYAISKTGAVIRLQETITGIQPAANQIPSKFSLSQNYPNPFNPVTTITFQIPFREVWQPKADGVGFVTLKVFDIQGRELKTLVTEYLAPGSYSVTWDASGFSSGIYFCKLESGNYTNMKKMILLK